MTKTFCIYLSGRGRAGAAKEWEKKVILREVNLATAFGIWQDTLAASWQAVDGAGGGLAGSWLGSPALDTHREVTLLSRTQLLKPLPKFTVFTHGGVCKALSNKGQILA